MISFSPPARTAHEAGRFEEAIATFNRVIALSANQPRTAAVASLLIGNVNMAQRKFGNAEIAYQKAIALNPSYADAYNNLGEALGELKQFPRASKPSIKPSVWIQLCSKRVTTRRSLMIG